MLSASKVGRVAIRAQPARSMATLSDIKVRMKSIGNIQKITKSMKMVAAAKLRNVQSALEAARPFGQATRTVFSDFAKGKDGEEVDIPEAAASTSPDDLLAAGAAHDVEGESKVLIVAVTSDRGLCGAINSSIIKAARLEAARLAGLGKDVSLFIIGEKGRAALSRSAGAPILSVVTEVGKTPTTFAEAALIGERLAGIEADRVLMVSNRFKSAISYETAYVSVPSQETLAAKTEAISAAYDFESDCVGALHEYHLATTLYNALLENATSEQSSRMTAMDNAATNAGDMLGKLSLVYNRTRQAVITRELIEIISGADSVSQ